MRFVDGVDAQVSQPRATVLHTVVKEGGESVGNMQRVIARNLHRRVFPVGLFAHTYTEEGICNEKVKYKHNQIPFLPERNKTKRNTKSTKYYRTRKASYPQKVTEQRDIPCQRCLKQPDCQKYRKVLIYACMLYYI